MPAETLPLPKAREDYLRDRYGELLTPEDLAKVLRYPSSEAVLKAHSRGLLPVPLVRFRARRGWYATARVVAECLDELDASLRSKADQHRQHEPQRD